MGKTAVLLVNLHVADKAGKLKDARVELLGLPLLKRALLMAHKSGVQHFNIICQQQDKTEIEKLADDRLITDKDIQLDLNLLENINPQELQANIKEKHFLLLSDHMVYDPMFLQNILTKEMETKQSWLLLEVNGPSPDALLKVKINSQQDRIQKIGSDLEDYQGVSCGLALVESSNISQLIASLKQEYSLSGLEKFYQRWLLKSEILPVDVDPGFCFLIHSNKTFKLAEKRLLNTTRKDTDGFVSRHLNRYISLFLSRWLLKWHITAKQVTLTNLLLGVVSAIFMALGGHINSVIGGFFFQFTSIVDGSDGEVAKLSFQESKAGARLDTLCDKIITFIFFTAMSIGLFRSQGNSIYIILGGLSLFSMGFLYYLLALYLKKTRGSGSLVKVVKDIEDHGEYSRQPGQTAISRAISVLFSRFGFLIRRDFFAFFFMVLCFFNGMALILWACSIIIPLTTLYLLIFYMRKT